MTVKLQPLLKLLNEGASQREISRQLDISRTSVKSYMDRFTASGMSNTRTATLRWYFIERAQGRSWSHF